MDFLIELIFRNPWKLGNQSNRLKAYSKSPLPQETQLIPLDATWGFLEIILVALLFITGFPLLCGTWIVFSDYGFCKDLLYIVGGFGIPTLLFFLMLCNTDSRYVLDLKNQQVIFVFTFFFKIYQRVISPFSEISSVELDAQEEGSRGTVWRYYIVIVRNDKKRIRITPDLTSAENFKEDVPLIAGAINCSFKSGIAYEKPRIMGF